MSLSLVGVMIGLPIALTARVVLGKEKYNEWINRGAINVEADFADENDLTSTLKKAGYETVRWMGFLKTHYKNGNFFFWEIKNEKYIAKMNAYDGNDVIHQFFRDVEAAANRIIFQSINDNWNSIKEVHSPESVAEEHFPTVYTDRELLIKVLRQNHFDNIEYSNDRILCSHEKYYVTFSRDNESEPFNMIIRTSHQNMKLFLIVLIV